MLAMTDETQIQPKQRAVRVKEIPQPDGSMAYEYSDGSIRDWRGHPLPGTKIPNDGHEITHENARELQRARWEKSRAAFAQGMAQGLKTAGPVEAWGKIAEKTVELLENAKSARGFADLARFAGEAGGFVPMARGREEMQEKEKEQPQIVVMLLQYIELLQAPAGDVIKCEFKD